MSAPRLHVERRRQRSLALLVGDLPASAAAPPGTGISIQLAAWASLLALAWFACSWGSQPFLAGRRRGSGSLRGGLDRLRRGRVLLTLVSLSPACTSCQRSLDAPIRPAGSSNADAHLDVAHPNAHTVAHINQDRQATASARSRSTASASRRRRPASHVQLTGCQQCAPEHATRPPADPPGPPRLRPNYHEHPLGQLALPQWVPRALRAR